MRHPLGWAAPQPYWRRPTGAGAADAAAPRRPALLRFASDTFMEEFQRVLERDPSKLVDLEALPETWKGPLSAAPAVAPPNGPVPAIRRRLARMRAAVDRRAKASTSGSAVAVVDAPPAATGPGGGAPAAGPLKLYQPAHQRYYLVAASLVCRTPGLPDHGLKPAMQEKASFVVRRVRTVAGASAEYGFVAADGGGSWHYLEQPGLALAPGEETLPLFPAGFQDDVGHPRRVLAGLLPVGRREVYVGGGLAVMPPSPAGLESSAGSLDPGAPGPPVDPRIALLSAEVIEPWKALVARAAKTAQVLGEPNKGSGSDDDNDKEQAARAAMRIESRETILVGSWYILLDFARFLAAHVEEVWQALPAGAPSPTGGALDLLDALESTVLPAALQASLHADLPSMTVKTSLRAALAAIEPYGDVADKLEDADGGFSITPALDSAWPSFVFPLADADHGGPVPPLATPPVPSGASALAPVLRKISALRDLVAAALPEEPTVRAPELPLAAKPVLAPNEGARFVVRCVLERPDCDPAHPLVLSDPSREFELAGFFDPDAPARPIRIALPVDTSPAGLRRAPKNTAFMVSDMLCGQIARAKGMGLVDLVRSVLPFPLHKDLDAPASSCKTDTSISLGMICSLSIPIITICALILLIIMVSLLDYIFRWLPYFIFCFPLPKFSAKPGSQS